MKKFEILRYLKRFSLLIFLVSLAGAAAIYLYADGRQKYTASVIIRYTNDGISDGYTPDGSELDVNEIYSSTVISQAMDALGASGRLSTIRSNISVTPVISEDQQTINDALLQKGEEVTYFPDTYKVSLVVDGEQGAGYARNMLDAIIQSYCTYYTEKYVEQKLSLNPSSGLLDNGYDYYECIRILENDTNEMQDYLLSKREHYPNFRSSRTGYTYADLCDIYSDFKKYTIPALYAYVLNGPQVRDGTVLQEYLANTIEAAKQNEQITTEQRDSLWSLTDQYVYKNADLLQNYFTDRGEVVSSDYILNNIELEGAGDKAQTTYDGLVLKLVSLEQQVASSQIDRQFQEEILQSFRNVDFGGTGSAHAFVATGITPGYRAVYGLESRLHPAAGTDPDKLGDLFCDFCLLVYQKYGMISAVYPDSAEQVLIRGLQTSLCRRGLNWIAVLFANAAKTPITDRINLTARLMAQRRFFYTKNAQTLADALASCVWDPKKVTENVRLDDGTSDIDTLDAYEYTIERDRNRLLRGEMIAGGYSAGY